MNLLYSKAYSDYSARADKVFRMMEIAIRLHEIKYGKNPLKRSLQKNLALTAFVYANIFDS